MMHLSDSFVEPAELHHRGFWAKFYSAVGCTIKLEEAFKTVVWVFIERKEDWKSVFGSFGDDDSCWLFML